MTNTLSPNPASGMVEASFVVPEGITQYTLKVLDSYQNIGQVKYEETGSSAITAHFNTSDWSIGTYTIALLINGEIVETLHLLVFF